MKRLSIAGGLLAACATLGFGAQDNRRLEVQMKEDIARLQGTWMIVSLEMEGHAVSPGMLAGARIAVQGDRFASTGMGAEYEGTIEIDPSPTPRTFNLKFLTGPEKGNTSFGIYEVDGDTWRICLTTRGNERPKKFAAEPGTGYALETLKRETGTADRAARRSATAPDLANVRFEPVPELAGEWSMVSATLDGQQLDRNLVKSGKRRRRQRDDGSVRPADVFQGEVHGGPLEDADGDRLLQHRGRQRGQNTTRHL